MRGAHRGVWCSKGQRLMEAKLFAAESKRPAQNGRALSAQRKVWVVKRGQETIGVLSPFALAGGHRRLRRQTAAFPPVNTGSPRPPKAATVHAHFERKPRLQRRTAVSAEGIPSADGKKNLYLSFGRRMFRMIATNAAGTIPEPPKISWIACGACARMDIFAPMP